MNKNIVNPIPKFYPYDICRIKQTGELVVVTEVNLNPHQDKDEYQWSFSITNIDKKSKSKCAWYDMNELEYVNNIFEIIAKKSSHPFSSSHFKFNLYRRK